MANELVSILNEWMREQELEPARTVKRHITYCGCVIRLWVLMMLSETTVGGMWKDGLFFDQGMLQGDVLISNEKG